MLADKYKLRIDDLSVIAATGAYLREKGRDAEWVAMGGTQPNFKIRYAPYDLAVRDMLFDRCRNEMAECLAAFFYYKPLSLLKNLAWLYGFRLEPPDTAVFASRYFGDVVERQFRQTSAILNQKGERPALFDVPGVILCILGSLLIVGRLYNPPLARAFVGCGIFLIASLAPTIVGYPGMHTIASTGIAVGIAIYFITIVALAAGWRAAGQRVAARA